MKKKINNSAGFSLVEMLMVILIVLLVSAVVAAGVPAAARAYNKVVDASNAQVLLSTAMVRLREEVGTSSDIVISGTPIVDPNEAPEDPDSPGGGTPGGGDTPGGGETPETDGADDDSEEGKDKETTLPPVVGRTISYDNSLGIRTHIDCCLDEEVDENQVIYIQEYADFDTTGKFYHPLVSKSASGEKLYITYDSVTDNRRGVITFHNVVVKNMNTQQQLTDKMDFKVRVLTFIEE